MFDEILVPTDGSECADTALGYARDLATRYDASVHVVCVVDSRTLENAPHHDEVERELAGFAEETSASLREAGLSVEHEVRDAVPHTGILEYVSENKVDLIVMGTHGRTGVERFVLGSVTEKVVRLSDAPVLTVKPRDGGVSYPFDDIVVPTDGSRGAEAAVDPAVSVATTYDARLHAVTAIDTLALGVDVRSATILDSLEDSAREALESIRGRATEAGVREVETSVLHGNPYQGIISYVEDHEVDLVVIGTHGQTGIERYLLGSVTEKVVRTSPVPVMTVRRSEETGSRG